VVQFVVDPGGSPSTSAVRRPTASAPRRPNRRSSSWSGRRRPSVESQACAYSSTVSQSASSGDTCRSTVCSSGPPARHRRSGLAHRPATRRHRAHDLHRSRQWRALRIHHLPAGTAGRPDGQPDIRQPCQHIRGSVRRCQDDDDTASGTYIIEAAGESAVGVGATALDDHTITVA